MESMFSKGTRVRVHAASMASLIHSDMIGWLGVVTDTDPGLGDGRIEIRTDEDASTWFILPADLELATPAPAADECALTIGTMVRVEDSCPSLSWRGTEATVTWLSPSVVELFDGVDHTRMERKYVEPTGRHIKPKERSRPAAEQPKADPYTGSNLTRDAVLHGVTNGLDIHTGRRARLVAALKSEMGRAFTPAHPVEGRSERVYGGRRWGEK
jgi:hypothetical protein